MADGPQDARELTDADGGLPGDTVDEGPYAGTGLYEFAAMYKVARRVAGWTPRQVDDLADWEFRAVFDLDGVDLQPKGGVSAGPSGLLAEDETGQPVRPSWERQATGGTRGGSRRPVASRRDFVAERMAHARGRGPKPETDAPSPVEQAGVSELMTRLAGAG